jgi:glutamate formiminotransferase
MNLTRPDLTSLREVYDFVRSEAHHAGVEVAESEIIGAIRHQDLDGATPQMLKATHFKETQILDNWIYSA